MQKDQHNTQSTTALLRKEASVDTIETNSLCCAAAGIITPSSSTTEVLTPHEKLREAAAPDATLIAQNRPPAQLAVGYQHKKETQLKQFNFLIPLLQHQQQRLGFTFYMGELSDIFLEHHTPSSSHYRVLSKTDQVVDHLNMHRSKWKLFQHFRTGVELIKKMSICDIRYVPSVDSPYNRNGDISDTFEKLCLMRFKRYYCVPRITPLCLILFFLSLKLVLTLSPKGCNANQHSCHRCNSLEPSLQRRGPDHNEKSHYRTDNNKRQDVNQVVVPTTIRAFHLRSIANKVLSTPRTWSGIHSWRITG